MPTVNICPKCGAMNVGDFANCMRCQAPLPAPQAAPPPQVPTQQPPQAPRVAVPPPPPAPAPASQTPAGLTCPYCRATVPPGNSFCSSCGRQVAGTPATQPPPPPAYPPPPAAYAPPQPAYGYPQQFANNSGTGGGPIPPEVPGWNWGAFFWSWIWGVANGVWVSILIAMLGPIGTIWLGLKGSEMAWQKRHFASVEQFKGTQRAWATWGWVLFILNLIATVIIFVLFGATIMTAIASGQLDPNDFNF